MQKKVLVAALVLILGLTFVGVAEDKVVIHHTGAFSGEVAQLNDLLTEEYGPPSIVHGKMGRVYNIWETGNRTRLVSSTTKVSMPNAVLSPALIFETLPEKYEPDLATHGGICGAVLQESKIMDVYAPYAVAFSGQGLYGPEGFKPGTTSTWDPTSDDFIEPIWLRTDPVLTELLANGFKSAKNDPGFKNLWEESTLPYEPTLHRGVVQVSSSYFVANDELNARWAELFKIDPELDKEKYNVRGDWALENKIWGSYDGEVHEVGGLDMETAAVVWTFRQNEVPVAVLRYPSDKARSEAEVQIEEFGQTAAAVGGYSFFYGLRNIIESVEEGELTVKDGKAVLVETTG